jgi:mono/diheme cytochrome c family protein
MMFGQNDEEVYERSGPNQVRSEYEAMTRKKYGCPLRFGPLLLGVFLFAGCASEEAQFHLNMMYLVDGQVQSDNQQAIADTLHALFGSPDEPRAPAGSGLDASKLSLAAGAVWSDQAGVKHGLYREHCAHCHGVSGDGRGPTALFLNPYPRDYRLGLFKFKSTERAIKPTNDDLRRILIEGIRGTAMPSFKLLPEDEVEALIEYVKYLTMRGEMERELARLINEDLPLDEATEMPVRLDPANNAEHAQMVQDRLAIVTDAWAAPDDGVVRPNLEFIPPDDRTSDEIAASIAAGRALFAGKADCLKCHGPTGLGDGGQIDWNDWNKPVKEFPERTASLVAQAEGLEEGESEDDQRRAAALWEHIEQREVIQTTLFPARTIEPRNLREGVYRGGRRPIDLFWRIHQGINGTPMPGGSASLTEEEIWQIVDYVRSLPYEPASRVQHQLAENLRERP